MSPTDTTGRYSRLPDDEAIAAGLRPSAPPSLAPGLGLTLYHGGAGIQPAVDAARELLAAVRPGIVCLHTTPDPTDGAVIAGVRALLPGVRVWVSPPANPLAGMPPAKARDAAERWASLCSAWDVEALILNVEGPSRPGLAGWTEGAPLKGAAHAAQVDAVLSGLRAGAGPRLRLGITSHDCPEWHRLRWDRWLGPDSPIVLHAPQVYAAPARESDPPTPLRGAQGRYRMAHGQWARWIGRVRETLALGGACCVPYVQGHGVSPEGTAWLLDQAADVLVWAAPSRLDAHGALALRVAAEVRRREGPGPGAVARAQRSLGLTPDGIAGPITRAALGL